MNKVEATEYAKKAIAILKKRAIANARKGISARYSGISSAGLVRGLEIPTTSLEQRAKVRSAMTRALKLAEELGIVKQGFRNNWVYCGPEVEAEEKAYEQRQKAEDRELTRAAKRLGLRVFDHDGDVVRVSRKALVQLANRVEASEG